MDVSQYLDIFLDEAGEHLQSLSDQIMVLEQEPENMDTINEIFRAAHSLKGMAGTMGYKHMQTLTHDMENVFSEVRAGNIKVQSGMIDTLFQCLDALDGYVNNIRSTSDEGSEENENLVKALNDILNGQGEDKSAPETAKGESEASQAGASEAAPVASGDEKWKDIPLGDTELTVLREAKKQGKIPYGFTVKVQESCILKAARAFLVFKAIEQYGEIVISKPHAQDIEDENFDFDFSIIAISDAPIDTIIAAASNVSEIESVKGAALDLELAAVEEHEEEALPVEEAAEAVADKQAASVPAPASNAPAKTDKKAAGKPVVNRTVRVDIEKLDVLMNLVSELIIAKNSLVATSEGSDEKSSSAVSEQVEYLESVTTSLHESVMKVRMVPIESVVSKFPRMIRDLSKNLGKKMELYMSGEDTELDRTVVDEIGDPLMHLLRNSADHGLESAELRKERGKPATGSIFLDAYQDGNNVIIEVRDDGNGIDTEAVKKRAIERGVVSHEQAESMSDKEIIDLLFNAGFSTAKEVSDVSGRGVGLDVVKSKIEALSGEVEVKSKLGVGSTWTIRLPLTLAIIQALMVTIGDEKYAISLGSIQTIEDIARDSIKLVQNKDVIHLRGSVIPLVNLHDILGVPQEEHDDSEHVIVVIVKKGDKLAGLVVDELIGQQEIVIKSLGRYINKSKIISGATILGDGEVALILDTNALM